MGALGIGLSLGSDALKIGLGQLMGHSVRLKDATNENSAATSAVSAFTKDVQDAVSALNAGSIDAPEAISYIQQTEQTIYTYLKKQIGPAGTAWREGGGSCDKSCTVGCCLYYSFIAVVSDRFVSLLQAGAFPATLILPMTYKSKYGYPGSPKVTLTVNPPKVSPIVSLLGGKDSVPGSITSSFAAASGVTPGSNRLLASVGLGGVSPTNLLLGSAAIVTVIVGISTLRKS